MTEFLVELLLLPVMVPHGHSESESSMARPKWPRSTYATSPQNVEILETQNASKPYSLCAPAVGSPPWGPASHIAGATKHRVRGGHPDVANGGVLYMGDRRCDRPPLVRALRALAPKPRSVARACAPHSTTIQRPWPTVAHG